MDAMMHRAVLAVFVVCAMLSCGQAYALGTPAGTAIANQADITFNMNGSPNSLASNIATLQVAEIVDVNLLLQTPQRLVQGGATSQPLLFTLTNTGNGTEAFALGAATTLAGDEFDPVLGNPSVFFDTDGSGDLTSGDVAYVSGVNDPVLAADESVTLLLVSDIPAGLSDGDRGFGEVVATAATGTGVPGSVLGGVGAGGVDVVFGGSGGEARQTGSYLVGEVSLLLSKSARINDPAGGARAVPGATIVYTVLVSATGTGFATGASFADPIPVNTTYEPGSLRLNGLPLTDGIDTDAGSFEPTLPEIRVQLGDLDANDPAQQVQFSVKIN